MNGQLGAGGQLQADLPLMLPNWPSENVACVLMGTGPWVVTTVSWLKGRSKCTGTCWLILMVS